MKGLVLATAAGSDLGLKRSHNEDSHAVWIPEDPAERARRGVLLVVADGMGGARAGEVASRLAVETVLRSFREAAGVDVLDDLRAAIAEANRAVHELSRSQNDYNGMGTTCTAAAIRGDSVWIGHVGDSRAYLIRGGEIRRLTEDHSLVAQLVARNELTEEQARLDRRRNVVLRSIGASDQVEVDAVELNSFLQSGDTLLICSDGLHGPMSDPEIADVAAEGEPQDVCARLISEANDRGGPDNITAIVVRADDEAPVRRASGFGGRERAAHAAPAPAPQTSVRWGGIHPILVMLLVVSIVLECVNLLLLRRGIGQ